MPNEFPPIWFETFLSPISAAPVDRELAFVQRHLPAAEFPRLLDVPCGIGRHAGPLASLGYHVLGIDRSDAALTVARRQYPSVEFRQLDMFELGSLRQTFDGVLCLWHSFGYGDAGQNRDVLAAMRHVLRPGGRLLLDVYNAHAAAALPATAVERRAGRTVRTRRRWIGRRLRVEIEYSDSDEVDLHEWEIYTPGELSRLAADVHLDVLLCCAWFDESIAPSSEHLRMQLLMEKPRGLLP